MDYVGRVWRDILPHVEESIELGDFEIMEDQLAELLKKMEALEARVADLEREIENCADEEHSHSTFDHLEERLNRHDRRISDVRDEIRNVEYRADEAMRKAESADHAASRAQSTANSVSRNSRGGYW